VVADTYELWHPEDAVVADGTESSRYLPPLHLLGAIARKRPLPQPERSSKRTIALI